MHTTIPKRDFSEPRLDAWRLGFISTVGVRPVEPKGDDRVTISLNQIVRNNYGRKRDPGDQAQQEQSFAIDL